MEATPSVWTHVDTKTHVACLIAYAGVFRDVVRVSALKEDMPGVEPARIERALAELAASGRVVVRDGWAALPCLEDRIGGKESALRLAEELIDAKMPILKRLGRIPIVEFVGISGSLAAGNPVRDENGRIDLDVFMIARSQCLWLLFIPMALLWTVAGTDPGNGLCFNLVMDGSDLSVYNRNLFTASEIRKLRPVSGLRAYGAFLRRNSWVDRYFGGTAGGTDRPVRPGSRDAVNKMFYVVYGLCRCLKNLSLEPLTGLSFRKDPYGPKTHSRIGASYGGHQAVVYRSFVDICREWFPDLIDEKLVERLFPDDMSVILRTKSGGFDEIMAKTGLRPECFQKYRQA